MNPVRLCGVMHPDHRRRILQHETVLSAHGWGAHHLMFLGESVTVCGVKPA